MANQQNRITHDQAIDINELLRGFLAHDTGNDWWQYKPGEGDSTIAGRVSCDVKRVAEMRKKRYGFLASERGNANLSRAMNDRTTRLDVMEGKIDKIMAWIDDIYSAGGIDDVAKVAQSVEPVLFNKDAA